MIGGCVLYMFVLFFFFFFKQKTAYEMRISDWSSDVCSSDLLGRADVQIVQWILQRHVGLEAHQFAADARLLGEFDQPLAALGQIGRASCRERECQYV